MVSILWYIYQIIKFYKELAKEIKKTQQRLLFEKAFMRKKEGLWDNLIWRKQVLEAI